MPPHDHTKIVYCVQGAVMDVVVDLRVQSPTYGQFIVFDLNAEKGNLVYISPGFAHGFEVLSESALMMYKVSTVYNPGAGIPWQAKNPILSRRDQSFVPLPEFRSPFP